MNLFVSLFSVLLLLGGQPAGKTSGTSAAAATELTSLSGKVTDILTGEELSGVSVSIPCTGMNTYSDLKGEFRFEGLQPGNYKLTVTMLSYRLAELNELQVLPAQSNEVMVKLKPQ